MLGGDAKGVRELTNGELFDDTLDREVRELFLTYFPEKKKEMDEIVKNFKETWEPKYRHLLTICKIDNDIAKIDVAILEALLNEVKGPSSAKLDETTKLNTQLRLALSWNRVDIARKNIFTEKNMQNIGSLNDLMYTAILENKVEFVKLFLENGLVLKNFATYRRLIKMYNEIPSNTDLFMFLERNNRTSNMKKKTRAVKKDVVYERPIFTYEKIGAAVQKLVDDIFKDRFTLPPFNHISISQTIKILADTVSI